MQAHRPTFLSNGASTPSSVHHFLTLACVCAALGMTGLQAQTVYRSVGPDGRVLFSDKPPQTPASKIVPVENVAAVQPTAALPYALRQVVAKYPVTLYTSSACAPCDEGRSLLLERGVPFAEKTVTTAQDATALQNLSGSTSLPFLTIGAQHVEGYASTSWTQYLDAAGYPAQSKLPASYRTPAATALTIAPAATSPAPAKATSPKSPPEAAAPVRPKANPNNPAGIQF